MRGALLQAVVDGGAAETRLPFFMNDCKHPISQGHTYMAQLIIGRILATETAAGARRRATCKPLLQPATAPKLPEPISADGWPLPSSRCASGQTLRRRAQQ